ncbi:MAG TPA: hypothetical protein P5137_07425, partial [Candidatus Brocadiia bacterium]|nr:hypothetical protein [Candidatus Brocadiia bacterium]
NTWNVGIWYYQGQVQSHTIAVGRRSQSNSTWTQGAGALNASPIGMGYLAVGGYLADLKSMYCGSTEGLKRTWAPDWSCGITQVRNLATLGGSDGKALTHGNYRAATLDNCRGTYPYNNNFIQNNHMPSMMWSHYAYRGAAIAQAGFSTSGSIDTGQLAYIPGVKPKVDFNLTTDWQRLLGRPPFKTLRSLSGRALASDVFGHWYSTSQTTQAPFNVGAGVYAHKDGYNVLYGDGHTAWYGDPQRRIAWRDYKGTGSNYYSAMGLAPLWYDVPNNLYFITFHEFDVAAGFDADTWLY